MASPFEVMVRFTADSARFNSGIGQVQGKIRGLGQDIQNLVSSRLTQLVSIGALAGGLKKAFEAADAFDASQRQLAATAKITGQSLGFLQKTAVDAKGAFGLSAQMANDFSIELTKLTGKAGQVEKTGEAIRAFLNLGAARGMGAEQTLNAVRQAILGIDEGTDKLFGKNPSVIYAEFAQKVGIAAGKMTDQQKAAALLAAAMDDGGKVATAYAEYLKSPQGQADQLGIQMQETAVAIGKSMNGVRLAVLPILARLAEWMRKFVGGIQLLGAEFPVYIGQVRVWAAELNESWGGALEGIAQKITGFYEWSKTWPEWVQWMFGFKLGQATIGNFAEFVRGSVSGGVDAAKAELQRLKAAYQKEAAEIVRTMDLATQIEGSTDPLKMLLPTIGPDAKETEKKIDKAVKEALAKNPIKISLDLTTIIEHGFASTKFARGEALTEAAKSGMRGPVAVAAPTATAPTAGMYIDAAKGLGLQSLSQGLDLAATSALDLAKGFTPLGLISTAVGEALKVAEPAINALLLPMRALGQLVGGVLNRAISYVTEGLGWLIYGLAKAVNKLIPFGDPLKGLENFGKEMIEGAKAARSGLTEVGKTAEKVSASLLNVSRTVNVAALRRAVTGKAAVPGGGAVGSGGGGVIITGDVHVHDVQTPVEFLDEIGRIAQRTVSRGGTTRLSLSLSAR